MSASQCRWQVSLADSASGLIYVDNHLDLFTKTAAGVFALAEATPPLLCTQLWQCPDLLVQLWYLGFLVGMACTGLGLKMCTFSGCTCCWGGTTAHPLRSHVPFFRPHQQEKWVWRLCMVEKVCISSKTEPDFLLFFLYLLPRETAWTKLCRGNQ